MRHRWLTAQQFATALRTMIATHRRLGFAEPIPEPTDQQVERAGAIVLNANEAVYGRYPYRALTAKAAYVFYELIKQHVFLNGNKRIATYFLLHLLEVHGYMLGEHPATLAKWALEVAESDPRDRERVMAKTRRRIDEALEDLEKWRFLRDLSRKLKR